MPPEFDQLGEFVVIFVVAVAGALLFVAAWRALRRSARRRAAGEVDLTIDVATLPQGAPPADGSRLTFYHTPVRLSAVVIAPAGREGTLPSERMLPATIDHLLPGLGALLESHHARIFRWPPQLSAHGFVHAFWRHATLPGDRGKGTAWLSLAGPFEASDRRYLAGLVFCSNEANNFGQLEVDRPGGWIDVLRIVQE